MKKLMGFFVLLVCIFSGCASFKGYIVDRGRDFKDIVTLTCGSAQGLYIHAGPISSGFYMGEDRWGLRGGIFIDPEMTMGTNDWFRCTCGETYILVFGSGGFYPSFIMEKDNSMYEDRVHEAIFRHKTGYDESIFGLSFYAPDCKDSRHKICHYTNIEFATGALFGVRLGVNPGEILDFMFGWTTLDIFNDDLECREVPCACMEKHKK